MAARATVTSLELLPLRIPFRFAFAHHLAERREARPQIVRLRLSDGSVGYGEALPRPYLTGESEATVRSALRGPLAALVLGYELDGLPGAQALLETPAARAACTQAPAAFCGLELALLDAAGRSSGQSVSSLLGGVRRTELPYPTAVIGFLPTAALRLFLVEARRRGVRLAKLKVGRSDDLERVALTRRLLGDEVALVLDANAAWTPDEAIARLATLEPFGLLAVEQPVARADIAGLARVRRAVRTPIAVDESLCTRSDAEALLAREAADVWNLRVGKCGGLLATLALARLAEARGLGSALGVLVGESAILAAAGRQLAACHPAFRWLEHEGAGLKSADVATLAPVSDGRAPWPNGPGLGIEVDQVRLAELADDTLLVEA